MTKYICKCGYQDVEPSCKNCEGPMKKMEECWKCGGPMEGTEDWGRCYSVLDCLERRVEKLEERLEDE